VLRRRLKACDYDDGGADSANPFLTRRRALSKCIANLHGPHRLYIPGSEPLDATDSILLAEHPENINLWLPSALPSASRDAQCIKGLPRLEYRMRYAQATDALHSIRSYSRLVRAYTMKTQSHISNTQGTVTRTQGLFDRANSKRARAVSTYRASWSAIAELAPNEEFGRWKDVLLELKDNDIRGPGHKESEPSTSRFVSSWIWTTASHLSTSPDDPGLHAALRVEWCKVQERAKRYEEEVELVAEEMRRTLVTLEWNAKEWETLAAATFPPPNDPAIDTARKIGLAAYAHKQANIRQRMVKVFVNHWYKVLKDRSLGSSWLQKYSSPPENKRRRLVSNVRLYHPASYKPSTNTVNEPADASPDISDEGPRGAPPGCILGS